MENRNNRYGIEIVELVVKEHHELVSRSEGNNWRKAYKDFPSMLIKGAHIPTITFILEDEREVTLGHDGSCLWLRSDSDVASGNLLAMEEELNMERGSKEYLTICAGWRNDSYGNSGFHAAGAFLAFRERPVAKLLHITQESHGSRTKLLRIRKGYGNRLVLATEGFDS